MLGLNRRSRLLWLIGLVGCIALWGSLNTYQDQASQNGVPLSLQPPPASPVRGRIAIQAPDNTLASVSGGAQGIAQPKGGDRAAAGQDGAAAVGGRLRLADESEALRRGKAIVTIFTALPDIDGNNPAALLTWKMQHRSNIAAIMSWVQLGIPEVIFFGSNTSCGCFMTEILSHLGPPSARRAAKRGGGGGGARTKLRCEPFGCYAEAAANADGVPRFDCMFAKAAELASTPMLMYSNSDLIYFDDLLLAIGVVTAKVKKSFMVGKRRDFNLTGSAIIDIDEEGDWLERFRDLADKNAVGHSREGMDFMIFPTASVPTMPAFLIGRIQWDNWVLLQAIAEPTVTTIEVSEVVMALHLNHGGFKASHLKNGTEYNKQLAVYLPHPYVKDIRVYHPGTIWLGRLDEVDVNLVSSDTMWHSRAADYFAVTVNPPKATCPDCFLVHNDQSADLKLYLSHEMAMERRTIGVVRVMESQLQQAIDHHCFAVAHGVHSVLFTTTEPAVYRTLKHNGILCHLLPAAHTSKDTHPLVQFMGFVGKALYDGYNVLVLSLEHLLFRPINALIDPDVDVQHSRSSGSAGLKTKLLFYRSRGRTYRLCLKIVELIKEELNRGSVAAHSWREEQLFEAAFSKAVETMDAASTPKILPFGVGRVEEYVGSWRTGATQAALRSTYQFDDHPDELCAATAAVKLSPASEETCVLKVNVKFKA